MKLKALNPKFLIPVLIAFCLTGHLNGQQPVSDTRQLINETIRFSSRAPIKLIIPLKEGDRDLSSFLYVNAEVVNIGSETIRVNAYLNNRWVDGSVRLNPGEKKNLQILLKRDDLRDDSSFPGMHGKPGGFMWLPFLLFPSTLPYNDNVKEITFTIKDTESANIIISKITASGKYLEPGLMAKQEGIFPFIDKYGQYIHAQWPGKVISDSDMKEAALKEKVELDLMPGPQCFDRFGGWKDGPLLNATGHFRFEKYNGKWWFVDPEGRLYWSLGLCDVKLKSWSTQITSREHFFSGIPAETEEWAFCFGKSGGKVTFNHGIANLYRKFGAGWQEKASDILVRRLRSWGINSFGNWSDVSLNVPGKNCTPYFMAIGASWPRLDGKRKGFPDVFDPGFKEAMQKAIENGTRNTRKDTFCIGYFIDNELDVRKLSQAIMTNESNSEAKKAFLAYLQEKYVSVRELNRKWNSKFRSWENLIVTKELPENAITDMAAFDLIIIDKYYKTCSEILKQNVPYGLYFGSRLNTHYYPDDQSETAIIRIAAKYCDAVGFNIYRFVVSDLILPDGIDKPSIIGEFHFGALDRGLLHTGLRSLPNQDERAEAYEDYVLGALNNPQIVGAHWFKYQDEPIAGVPGTNSENYQIGAVDVCDNPYPEFISSIRKIGYSMYRTRFMEK